MGDIKLTRDADVLICTLYKSYLQARKNGKSKPDAKILGGAAEIQSKLMPQWSLEEAM